MDMIIKAIAVAEESVEHGPRSDLDLVSTRMPALRAAALAAGDLGCEEEDVRIVTARLDVLADLLTRRQESLRESALSDIALQDRNGRNIVGMFPCISGAALRENLSESIARLRDALGDDLQALVTIGNDHMRQVNMDSIQLHHRHVQIGSHDWPLHEITAVSRLDGFGFIAGDTLVRVDCDLPELGMPTEDVRSLRPGTKVVTMEETSGESADGQERTYPIGTLAEVSHVDTLPMPQGLAVTVIIGPQDGDEAIVNVFDEGDAWYPIQLAETAVMQPSPDKVEEAFVRLCAALGVPATAGAYLEVPRILAAARERA